MYHVEPLDTNTSDSVSCNCWLALPSIVSAPTGVSVSIPVPSFLKMVNQLAPTVAAYGSVNVPTPLSHTFIWARAVLVNVVLE